MANVLNLVSLSLGGLIGALIITKIFRTVKIQLLSIMFGVAAFFISMFIQTPVQQLPFLFEGIKTVDDILSRGVIVTLIAAFYMGFIAGAIQEMFKYVFLKKDNANTGLSVGLGFGLTEVVYLLINAALTIVIYGSSGPNISWIWYLFSGIERLLVVIFHTVTAVYMTFYGINGLILTIVSHGAIDSFAALIQFCSYVRGYDTFVLGTTGILYVLILALDLSFIKTLENIHESVTEAT